MWDLACVVDGGMGGDVSFGGTSLSVVVSVGQETIEQIEYQMMVGNYGGL